VTSEHSPAPPRLFLRVGLIAALFALSSAPLLRVATPQNGAFAAAASELPVDLAIVGDSRAHVGVSPARLLESLTGLRIYNFANDGSDVLHHYDFVDRALLGKPPRVILWAPNPLGFNDRRVNNRLEQLHAMDLGMLRRAGAPLELLLDLVTMRVFPPYRKRPVIAEKVSERVEALGLKSLPLQNRLLGLHYNEPPRSREYHALPDGQEPFTVLDWQDRFERGVLGYATDYAGLGKSDWHLRIGRALLARAQAAGVLVVIVELPVSPQFRAHQGIDPRHLAWRHAMQAAADETGALYWDHTAYFDDDHVFGDPAHMAEPAAMAYSHSLGAKLAADPRVRVALERAH